MQNPKDYRRYAEECERIARNGSPEHREILLKIAGAWRECALNAERKIAISPPRLTVIDTGNLPPPLGGPFHTAPGSVPPAMVICRPAVSACRLLPGTKHTEAKTEHGNTFGGFIVEAMVARHLARRKQSSTSAGRERSVTSLAIC
jgi:hypothetical protein